jgi:hypothetical protein
MLELLTEPEPGAVPQHASFRARVRVRVRVMVTVPQHAC